MRRVRRCAWVVDREVRPAEESVMGSPDLYIFDEVLQSCTGGDTAFHMWRRCQSAVYPTMLYACGKLVLGLCQAEL